MQAFIIVYFNAHADTQIKELLCAYRAIILQNLRFYDINKTEYFQKEP